MTKFKPLLFMLAAILPDLATAGAQVYEPLSASVQAALHKSVADAASPRMAFKDAQEAEAWLAAMGQRLERAFPDAEQRRDFLITVHYEASRAGLDPQMVLGLIQVENGFKKYAISTASARGYQRPPATPSRAFRLPLWPCYPLATSPACLGP